MSLIQQSFAIDHNDVQAAQELLDHPTLSHFIYKVLLIKEQQVLSDIVGFAAMGENGGPSIDTKHKITMLAGYQQALQEFWPSLQSLAKRDIAQEQAATEKKNARRPRRNK